MGAISDARYLWLRLGAGALARFLALTAFAIGFTFRIAAIWWDLGEPMSS